MDFEVEWMVFLLFPPVRELASVLMLAAISVGLNEVFGLPLGALLLLIFKDMRLPPEVLPIVSVYTYVSCMGSV
jgi:hypothetical protein